MIVSTRAPAKINLSLHILGRRHDGYHELESLVAFAGCGDVLTLDTAGDLSLGTDGPTAASAGAVADNLVLRAARNLAELCPDIVTGRFTLTKRLPVAAGIGGGSSDAAAALRLLAQVNGMAAGDARVFEAARATGADVPVCLDPRARVMRGIGEKLGPPLALRPMLALLINPGVKVETRTVFGMIGLAPGEQSARGSHPAIAFDASFDDMLAVIDRCRNDMEPPAGRVAPAIGQVLERLRAAPGCRLARMSGSGATCFGLFDNRRAMAQAADAIRGRHPDWWVRRTLLR